MAHLAMKMGSAISTGVYAFRDHAGKMLSVTVLPKQRDPVSVGHAYLDCVHTCGGVFSSYCIPFIPLTSTSGIGRQVMIDQGVETQYICGFQTTLKYEDTNASINLLFYDVFIQRIICL
jgi:hypothetical protein